MLLYSYAVNIRDAVILYAQLSAGVITVWARSVWACETNFPINVALLNFLFFCSIELLILCVSVVFLFFIFCFSPVLD